MKTLLQYLFLIISLSGSTYSLAQLPGAGNAYDFNSSYISAPDNASLNPSFITLEAWIKADSWGTNFWENVIISKDGWAFGEQGYTLRAGANGTLSFNFGTPGAWVEVTSAPVMLTGKWYHVAGSYDGTTLRLYINGEEVNTTTYSGTIAASTYELTIGRITYTAGGSRFFDGMIDEVRIWSEALPQTSIQDYMCKKLTAVHPQYASLAAYWNFDDVSVVPDGSPNTNDATNYGSTQAISSAAIGDESIHAYGSPVDITLPWSTIDSVRVESISPVQTIHIYRVDMQPNTINATSSINVMDYSHYYGVFVGSTTPYTYDLSYYYSGNMLSAGNESYLNLAGRLNPTITQWSPQGATVNQPLATVERTYSNAIEVMLAIACPVINLNVTGTQSVCTGETLTVFDQANNANYQWNNISGPIAGQTSNSIDLTTSGSYYLVANDGMCVDTSNVINFTVNTNPTVNFGTLNAVFCTNDPDESIVGGTPAGGAYSGTGIIANDFSPSMAGAGAYTLYYDYTDGNGCSGIDSVTITVNSAPATPVITNNASSLCISSAGPGATYTWTLDGSPIAGSDTCITATANGVYSVIVTINGCSAEATGVLVDNIGLEEIAGNNSFSVSPNPSSETIEITLHTSGSQQTISLLDAQGRLLQLTSLVGQNLTMNLSTYQSGIYFIALELDGNTTIQRIIKN